MLTWTCAHCEQTQIASTANHTSVISDLHIGETNQGRVGIRYVAFRCLNTECNELTLSVFTSNITSSPMGHNTQIAYPYKHSWNLLPASSAKPQPEYIPEPILQDYYEACKIKNDSPKASSTLARRCLQGMIRDFCGIVKPTLFKEITTLEEQLAGGTAPKGVDDETIAAITAIRKLGNIGAHMETDINVIVDVDPDEAQALIGLIEMLFIDWYVARHKRQQRLAGIEAIAVAKEQQKQSALAAPAQPAIAAPAQKA